MAYTLPPPSPGDLSWSATLRQRNMDEIEFLARALHEAGREAVLHNKVLKKDGAPVGQIHFKEWDELDEDAREGRRIQARWLLDRFTFQLR